MMHHPASLPGKQQDRGVESRRNRSRSAERSTLSDRRKDVNQRASMLQDGAGRSFNYVVFVACLKISLAYTINVVVTLPSDKLVSLQIEPSFNIFLPLLFPVAVGILAAASDLRPLWLSSVSTRWFVLQRWRSFLSRDCRRHHRQSSSSCSSRSRRSRTPRWPAHCSSGTSTSAGRHVGDPVAG